MPDAPIFRPSKRRKVYRKRRDEDDSDAEGTTAANSTLTARATGSPLPKEDTPASHSADEGSPGLSVAEIVRRRKKARSKRPGIVFTNAPHARQAVEPEPNEVAKVADEAELEHQAILERANSRFMPQTGKVKEVMDKHMMEYIDAKMAELRNESASETNPTSSAGQAGSASSIANSPSGPNKPNEEEERQSVGAGKLMEVDLGPEAALRNRMRTEAAVRKLHGLEEEVVEEEVKRKGKPRLGRDGKPWRGKKRRTSADIARDKLVEDILKESTLDIYEASSRAQASADDQVPADDRIAEQFQKEFLESLNAGRRRPPAPPPSKGAKPDEKPKGPKLGGSRSARAAMRERDEKSKKK
ncbi:hypothetical protein K402DRAFT_413122 [Aulographum hederae CBS 113979]|uniref:Hepatocellular carcinoma-associated antigen 59-domain-containing protein n=1 Tax=Aulographum hederae CBS 113979 TaxID=1176131 RepID=A0A6G1GY66_9PEZI|nr:hypothetical protein K402DRAFT_413122 [Aulographum hederae CBS 113979]